MPRPDETFRDRLRKISLLHWGLISIGASGVSGAAMPVFHPPANSAEAAGRAAAQFLFVAVGIVLIVLHFVKRPKRRKAP